MTDPLPTDAEPNASFPIVRDSTFVRFCADKIIPADLGRDVEVAFLQMGPIHTEQLDFGDYESVRSDPVFTEVARLRIDYPALLNFAVTFIQLGISQNKVRGDAVLKSIEECVVQHEQSKNSSND